MSNQENIFYEKQGDTSYSITKGIFYIKYLNAKMMAYRVMKHIKYEKPIVDYTLTKTQAEICLKEFQGVCLASGIVSKRI
mgnify:CR=1 FL=1